MHHKAFFQLEQNTNFMLNYQNLTLILIAPSIGVSDATTT
jgi:hypothetical protein